MAQSSPIVQSKIKFVYFGMFLLSATLVAFAFRWQVVEATKFQEYAAQRTRDEIIPALRGTIYAADNSTLAYSVPRYNVYIYIPELLFAERKNLQTRDEFADKLSGIIDMTSEQVLETVDQMEQDGIYWQKIADKITVEDAEAIKSLTRDKDSDLDEEYRGKISGYDLIYTSERIYPEGELFSQTLGLTMIKDDGVRQKTIGRGGLEGEWNGILEPLLGFISGERDAKGNAVGLSSERTIEAKRGSSVYTSIDKQLQQIVEKKLEWGVKKYKAKSGSIVIMQPRTGRVMAMANYPTYDPNVREATDPNVYGNKAVSEPYEIGSVGKVYTLASALDLNVAKPSTVLLKKGHKGCEKIHKDLEPVCTFDKKPQPAMPLRDAFRRSDNLYFLHLAKRMEEEDFYNYLQKFGMGQQPGIDVAGESFGWLKPYEQWNIGDVAAYSYGHSYEQTVVQAASAVGALANYGVRMQPQVVTKIVDVNGKEINYDPIPIEKVVERSTVKLMDNLMHQVYLANINYWEWRYQGLKNYRIAMKSGTALIPNRDRPGYSSNINTTYVGYDASPDRKFIMVVRLERPLVGDLSSYNARIVWLETFKAFKDYLGVRKKSQF